MEKQMAENAPVSRAYVDRRGFIGGSDARTIMGADEAALLRLWREKRGEAEPEDLSGNLIVQLGLATEALNRHWYERSLPCSGRPATPLSSTKRPRLTEGLDAGRR
jgi:predicted phage-related endonuclease